jgi:hypothetical protein
MPNKMFSNFSEVQYTLGTGKIVTIKDFFGELLTIPSIN